MRRTTKADTIELIGETQWMSPFHLTYPHGVPTEGVRSNAMLGNILGRQLTDRKIDAYQSRGVYTDRKYYRKQLAEHKAVDKILHSEPRLVYNIETQEFEEVK